MKEHFEEWKRKWAKRQFLHKEFKFAPIPVDESLWERLHLPDECPILGCKLQYGFRLSDAQRNAKRIIFMKYKESRQAVGKHARPFNLATLDRVVPEKGYVDGNVIVISDRANRLKNNGTAEEHEKIAAYIRANS